MDEESGFVTVEGIKLECRHIFFDRKKEAPTLVFLHEGLGCVDLWRDFPENLCRSLGLNGFIFSRQGYGKSDPVSLPRPIDFMHHEALNILSPCFDAAKIDSAILIGHSDGGSSALINAGGVKDPRVKAITTIAAHVFNEELTVKSIQKAKIGYESTNLRQRLKKYHGTNVDCAFWGWNEVWLNPKFQDWNIEEFLPIIEVPVLILQGSEDQYGSQAQVMAIQNGLSCPNETVIIEKAQHSPHLEKQNETIRSIVTFMDKYITL